MNAYKGLLGIVGVWLTMALMPLAEFLQLSPHEATLLRGISGVVAIGVAVLLRRIPLVRPDRHTILLVGCFTVATICLFQAITAWGANKSILFLDLAVLIPVLFAWRRRQVVGRTLYGALLVAMLGTAMALRVWQGGVDLMGLCFSVGALVANGLFIEYASKATQESWNKAFWMSVGLVFSGLSVIATGFSLPEMGGVSTGAWLGLVLLFSVGTGALNFYCFFVAASNLKPVELGVLVLGVTPIVMVSSYYLLGSTMGIDQIFGVVLTLSAASIFGSLLRKTGG